MLVFVAEWGHWLRLSLGGLPGSYPGHSMPPQLGDEDRQWSGRGPGVLQWYHQHQPTKTIKERTLLVLYEAA